MKTLFTFFERISATLILGVIFSFGISSVLATYTPSVAPADPYQLITPTFNALYIGNGEITEPSDDDVYVEGVVTAIGGVTTDYLSSESGGVITSSSGITVTGNIKTSEAVYASDLDTFPSSSTSPILVSAGMSVTGTLKSDTLDNYSGTDITVNAPVLATSFGDIYYKTPASGSYVTCTSSTCPGYSASTTLYYASASCNVGDYILGCNGYLTTATSTVYYKGAYITKSTSGSGTQYFCKAYASTSSITSNAVCLSPNETQGTNTSSTLF